MPGSVRLHRAPPGLELRLSETDPGTPGRARTSTGDARGGLGPAIAQAAATARRELSGRILAATLRSVRDLDIAEEATADAFLLALQHWPTRGIPDSVEAWLITAARRRAIDKVRQAKSARQALLKEAGGWSGVAPGADGVAEAAVVGDDELRMVVLCCDPRITVEEQTALTLRLACGVSTAGIARAFRVPTPTMAARNTRAKAKLVRAGKALDLPDNRTVDERLPVVVSVVHLAFTLAHTATDGAALTDEDLADRTQYLAGVLAALRPGEPEFLGLLALMLLTRARQPGRFADDGAQVLLEDTDRGRWNEALRRRGLHVAGQAWAASPVPGRMTLQAAIAAVHAAAPTFAATDWARIVQLYGRLLVVDPAPATAVGRSMALSYLLGPAAGLADLDEVLELVDLAGYPYAAAARAQLLERLGQYAEAGRHWRQAAEQSRTEAERAFFTSRADGQPS